MLGKQTFVFFFLVPANRDESGPNGRCSGQKGHLKFPREIEGTRSVLAKCWWCQMWLNEGSDVVAFESATECHVTCRRPKLGQKYMYFEHVFRSRILSILFKRKSGKANRHFGAAAASCWANFSKQNFQKFMQAYDWYVRGNIHFPFRNQ